LAATATKPIAIFGAGNHTPWMFEQVADLPAIKIASIYDDRIPPTPPVPGIDVQSPTQIDPDACAAVVLSSWHQTDALRQRATALLGDKIPLVGFDRD